MFQLLVQRSRQKIVHFVIYKSTKFGTQVVLVIPYPYDLRMGTT